MSGRGGWTIAGLFAAAAAGAVAAIALSGGAAVRPPGAPPVTFATVVRTNLATTTLTAGTLGYAPTNPIVNRISGTYTWLPRPGTVIRPGQVLYQVDHLPVVFMRGRIPAWRAMAPGMTGGPDVAELQRNLIALGYATGLFTAPSGLYDWLTVDAVDRWQTAHGYPATGQIALGQIVFLPATVVVGAVDLAPGQAASTGQTPYGVTARQRVVTVPLGQNLPPVNRGEKVSIILPSGIRIPGQVTTIGPASPGSSQSSGATQATVVPNHQEATGTGQDVGVQVSLVTQRARHVLAVPVSALLALAGGGYGIEVVTPSGAHRLVGVTTGLFASTLVQVSGSGVRAGMKVVTAQ